MFFDHNEIKLEINNRKVSGKSPNNWNKHTFIPIIQRRNQKEIKSILKLNENDNIAYQTLGGCN